MDTTEIQKKLPDIMNGIQKNSITLQYEASGGKIAMGKSKFGGNPHLPANFQWFYYEGKSYDEVTANRPLSFLAQINLKEAKPFDRDGLLPDVGILYFFYEIHSMKWGFDPQDQGCARVYYYDGPLEKLVETEPPQELGEDFIFPEMAISMSASVSYPEYNEFVDYYNRDYRFGEYEAQKELLGIDEPDYEQSKLLGYTDIIQNPMLYQTEMAVSGIFCGDNRVHISEEQESELFENSRDWTLLFQMGTVAAGDFQLMFGDSGLIYFLIRKQDLAVKNFDNTWLILQCY